MRKTTSVGCVCVDSSKSVSGERVAVFGCVGSCVSEGGENFAEGGILPVSTSVFGIVKGKDCCEPCKNLLLICYRKRTILELCQSVKRSNLEESSNQEGCSLDEVLRQSAASEVLAEMIHTFSRSIIGLPAAVVSIMIEQLRCC